MRKHLLLLGLSLLFLQLHANENIVQLLPDTNAYPEISTYQAAKVYPQDDLFILINGGAEMYYEYGFEQVVHTIYRTEANHKLEVYIYEMSDVLAAYGIFSQTRSGHEVISSGTAFQRASSEMYELLQRDKYFMVISWSEGAEQNQEYAKLLGTEMINNIKAPEDLPELLTQYTEQGYDWRQVKYLRGTLALSGIYFFSHKDIFAIREAVCVTKEYEKQIDFYYNDSEKTKSQFESLKTELSGSKRFINYEDLGDHFSVEDKRGRQIGIKLENDKIVATVGSGKGVPDF